MREELNPVTREEMFLAKAAGQDTPELTPITRVERFLQNLIDHVKSIGSGGGGTGGGGATPDWNAAEGEPGHVLNRPFYSEYETKTLLEETTLTVSEEAEGAAWIPHAVDLTGVPEVEVTYNGTKYVCPVMEEVIMNDDVEEGVTWNFGNLAAMDGGESTGEPFIAQFFDDRLAVLAGAYGVIAPLDGSPEFTVSITGVVKTVHPLPEKYLPQNGMLYRDSSHRLYKTADTSNPDNRLIKSELLDMIGRGAQLWVSLTDDGATVYVPVNSVRIIDVAAFVKAEYVNGSTSTYIEGHAFNTRDVE